MTIFIYILNNLEFKGNISDRINQMYNNSDMFENI